MNAIQKRDGFEGQKLLVLSEQVQDALAANPLTRQYYVTDIGYFPAAKYHYRHRLEGSPSHIVVVCTDGAGWVESAATGRVDITKGQWFLVPAHAGHAYGAYESNPWSIYWFHFDGEQANEIVNHLLSSFVAFSPISITSEFQRRFVSLFEEVMFTLERGITNRHMVYAASAARHMLGLLQYASELVTQSSHQSQVVERSIVLMQERLDDVVSLQELANNVGLSKTQFTHLFKKETGRTPIDYYLHLKMQRACQYLELTDWTIKQISLTLNIADPYYFSRMFHKLMGVCPSEYRLNKKG